ncbi:MAG: asparagine synthase (glutamine-hydrolyzing) [Verrucomicrobiales bacterium]|nr:asparagine synthase (glutamine-hydrolyzing) [Verrucomicrobiales bacterium]
MCGIAGIVDWKDQSVTHSDLELLESAIRNRGPDSRGFYEKEGLIGLVHRRLRVIDLSEQAAQPMTNEDGTLRIVFNGEIYNFQELRKNLEIKGHVFRSNSDTEVIVHGFEEWGEKLFAQLDGMFAIAIWDERTKSIVLARDRFGKKPLFYTVGPNRSVSFSSDIKSLWNYNQGNLDLSTRAIDAYLQHLSPSQDHCIFEGVEKIPPGTWVRFRQEDSEKQRYWTPDFREKQNFSLEDALEGIEEKLTRAVRKRLVSDVPLGAFLSGGIDSSLIVAMMSEASDKPPRTFSVGFEEAEFSEFPHARAVAERYGVDHTEITLKTDVLSILPDLVWEFGEPFGDSSAIPCHYISKAARKEVTVALTGDGGDEIFGGYDTSRASHFANIAKSWFPRNLWKKIEQQLEIEGKLSTKLGGKMATLIRHGTNVPTLRCSGSLAWDRFRKRSLYTEAFRDELGSYDSSNVLSRHWESLEGIDLIDQNLLLTILGRLPNDYLIKIDVASMRHGLELRSPFLDRDLADLSETIPSSLKVRGGIQKFLLKKLAERYLPKEVIYRKKQGFSLPIRDWFRGDWALITKEFLLHGQLRETGWFDMPYLDGLLNRHINGMEDHTHRIWSLLVLEVWFRLFITKELSPDDSLS